MFVCKIEVMLGLGSQAMYKLSLDLQTFTRCKILSKKKKKKLVLVVLIKHQILKYAWRNSNAWWRKILRIDTYAMHGVQAWWCVVIINIRVVILVNFIYDHTPRFSCSFVWKMERENETFLLVCSYQKNETSMLRKLGSVRTQYIH